MNWCSAMQCSSYMKYVKLPKNNRESGKTVSSLNSIGSYLTQCQSEGSHGTVSGFPWTAPQDFLLKIPKSSPWKAADCPMGDFRLTGGKG